MCAFKFTSLFYSFLNFVRANFSSTLRRTFDDVSAAGHRELELFFRARENRRLHHDGHRAETEVDQNASMCRDGRTDVVPVLLVQRDVNERGYEHAASQGV